MSPNLREPGKSVDFNSLRTLLEVKPRTEDVQKIPGLKDLNYFEGRANIDEQLRQGHKSVGEVPSVSSWCNQASGSTVRRWCYEVAEKYSSREPIEHLHAIEFNADNTYRRIIPKQPIPEHLIQQFLADTLGLPLEPHSRFPSNLLGLSKSLQSGTCSMRSLGECGDQKCGTHRIVNPAARNGFETLVRVYANELFGNFLARDTTTEGNLCYTSFGSGLLLSDMRILAHLQTTFGSNPFKRVCLVDKMYASSRVSCPTEEHLLHYEALDQFAALFPQVEVFVFSDVTLYRKCCLVDTRFCAHVLIQCDFHSEGLDESVLLDVSHRQALLFRLLNLCCGEAPLPRGPHALEQMEYATYADVRQKRAKDSNDRDLICLAVEVTRPPNF